MIKFLVLSIIIIGCILGFRLIDDFDYNITLSLLDYQIEISMVIFCIGFLLAQLLFTISLKIIFVFLGIPNLLKQFWYKRQQKKINVKLINSFAEFIKSNKYKALTNFKATLAYLDPESLDDTNVVLSALVENQEAKIPYLKPLLKKSYYSFYAAKKLAKIYYNLGNYKDAEHMAVKAFNDNDTDTGLMLLLIRIYAKQSLWPKLIFIVSKLQRTEARLLKVHGKEIASYYYLGAKSLVNNAQDEEAFQFLESALAIKPDHINSLRLYMELNINRNNRAAMQKMLATAFAAKPTFAIARMYIQCSDDSPAHIYRNLSNISTPERSQEVFLAVAAYLKIET